MFVNIDQIKVIETLPTFDLCSDVQTECGPDYFCFNGDDHGLDDHVVEYITESESEGLVTPRSDIEVEQTPVKQGSDDVQQPGGDDDDSEEKSESDKKGGSESPPPLRSRRGRAIKKTKRFGFDD